MKKVIVVTLFKRPTYTSRVLDWLGQCHGVEEYSILLHIEPGCHPVLDLAQEFPHPGKVVVENRALLGCTRNIYESLDHGFRHADFVIHFEDDVAPARDCLRYFEWARNRFEGEKDVFTVSAYQKSQVGPDRYYSARRVRWFNSWGWGTWHDRWLELRENWPFGASYSWDIGANRLRGDRCQIQPDLARSQNIGAEDGAHCPSPEWHRDNHWNEFGAWSVPLDPIAKFTLASEEE
ncbi:glycosyltransferase family protein [Limnoglobus roseus]|uniref:alpha-1,3-mannosyl-glycoprotein 2-beta-N-acetylglucosaminyltransferase n=1 Tax=Limnoglobus roseus TaxID=2598579 RepID=A0A5C1ALP8_9BACT|nr:glycosyl transferase family 13 [Limnoglobus roseus]QEL18662.1 hypothetical protein PX52LOC_05696 [Limnoglobus roseus]